MPYIPQDERNWLDIGAKAESAGQLNYILTTEILSYLGENPNYQLFNDAIGCLEACKLELYRRMVGKYEDQKISENGDVYEPGT